MRIQLFRDTEGEPRLWSHGINESARKKPGAWPFHYRWFLHGPSWCFNVEWSIQRSSKAMLLLRVGEGDGPEISWWIGVPFLLSLYLTLEWPKLARITPKWRTKSHIREEGYWDMPITRNLGFRIFDGRIWVDLWADDDNSSHNKGWQQFNWGPKSFLLGRKRYSQHNEQHHEVEIAMLEGRYPATVTTYIAQWKRPRWPFATQVHKAEINIPDGIPVPGKGDNSWDMDDDAVYSMTTPATTVHEAKQKIFDSVMRDRIRYAAADWQPANGWPQHMIKGGE